MYLSLYPCIHLCIHLSLSLYQFIYLYYIYQMSNQYYSSTSEYRCIPLWSDSILFLGTQRDSNTLALILEGDHTTTEPLRYHIYLSVHLFLYLSGSVCMYLSVYLVTYTHAHSIVLWTETLINICTFRPFIMTVIKYLSIKRHTYNWLFYHFFSLSPCLSESDSAVRQPLLPSPETCGVTLRERKMPLSGRFSFLFCQLKHPG